MKMENDDNEVPVTQEENQQPVFTPKQQNGFSMKAKIASIAVGTTLALGVGMFGIGKYNSDSAIGQHLIGAYNNSLTWVADQRTDDAKLDYAIKTVGAAPADATNDLVRSQFNKMTDTDQVNFIKKEVEQGFVEGIEYDIFESILANTADETRGFMMKATYDAMDGQVERQAAFQDYVVERLDQERVDALTPNLYARASGPVKLEGVLAAVEGFNASMVDEVSGAAYEKTSNTAKADFALKAATDLNGDSVDKLAEASYGRASDETKAGLALKAATDLEGESVDKLAEASYGRASNETKTGIALKAATDLDGESVDKLAEASYGRASNETKTDLALKATTNLDGESVDKLAEASYGRASNETKAGLALEAATNLDGESVDKLAEASYNRASESTKAGLALAAASGLTGESVDKLAQATYEIASEQVKLELVVGGIEGFSSDSIDAIGYAAEDSMNASQKKNHGLSIYQTLEEADQDRLIGAIHNEVTKDSRLAIYTTDLFKKMSPEKRAELMVRGVSVAGTDTQMKAFKGIVEGLDADEIQQVVAGTYEFSAYPGAVAKQCGLVTVDYGVKHVDKTVGNWIDRTRKYVQGLGK
jgi:cyanate lyase